MINKELSPYGSSVSKIVYAGDFTPTRLVNLGINLEH